MLQWRSRKMAFAVVVSVASPSIRRILGRSSGRYIAPTLGKIQSTGTQDLLRSLEGALWVVLWLFDEDAVARTEDEPEVHFLPINVSQRELNSASGFASACDKPGSAGEYCSGSVKTGM